jgi:hypothetical protein
MANQTTTKLIGLMKDLKMYVHGIPYISTFTILQNIIINLSYSMLLGRPWFRDAKMAHDWGNDIIIIPGNGIIKTIVMIKHLVLI